MSTKKGPFKIYIGTSGWSYDHWKETFYPEGLKQTEWLHYYSDLFSTVEINTTFYHTTNQKTVQHWYTSVPKDFIFAIKTNRYISHMKRLHDCEKSLKIFYESIQALKSKIGPILIQLPPTFKLNEERFIEFIKELDTKYRYTFEFRHDSWFVDQVYEILSHNNIALCITDLNGKLSPEEITADFTYIRLHGPQKAYTGSYKPAQLKTWKKKIDAWIQNCSVFCYFDNDEKSYASKDALYLQNLLKKE